MTGVTVALLALGLIAAGVGTAVFLRNTLIASTDDQLRQLADTSAWKTVVDPVISADGIEFAGKTDYPSDYYVAIYDPNGERVIVAGGRSAATNGPVFPENADLEFSRNQTDPFQLPSAVGGAPYKAIVQVFQVPNVPTYYTQLIALPLSPIDRVVTQFLGIYGVLAAITIIAGAFLTRLLVTLAFRNLGQVESTAMAIAGGDFSQRMTDVEPGTEVGRLKIAINTMLGRIDGALSDRDATVRQMRRFIGDASHELRTPLVTVRGYAELYRMGAITGDEDVAQAMERIEKEAMRMGVLVEDLLALARLDERRDVVIAPVDLRPIARDAAMDVRAAAPQRPVTVLDDPPPLAAEPAASAPPDPDDAPDEDAPRRGGPQTSAIARAGATLSLLRRRPRSTDAAGRGDSATEGPVIAEPVPPIVLGDENRIRQVVTNLLGNARRFTSEDSPIELRIGTDVTAGMGWIGVIDHGEGIPEQIRDKIFQRFWRADTSRTRETGGTGLGLSIVASIVDALHGTVGVDETPGGGATFRVAFPLAQTRNAADHLFIETQPIPRLTDPPRSDRD
ncbi:HAMP domain-containing sensor histidine kinase [Microbacterium sp. 1P10UB]|uniref:sensor histidine kinase n=1 Tax=unclassified Microbacterium TaxID=2609290 RepID=UPI0039A3C272